METKQSLFPKPFKNKTWKSSPETWEWALIGLAFLLPLWSFMYWDTHSVIRCGIEVFKSIFGGQFGDYYAFAKEAQNAGLMAHPPTYDIVFYLTVGIWELPVAIFETVTGMTLESNPFMLMYSKLLLVVFAALCTLMVRKIALELKLGEKLSNWAAFMFATTGFLYAYLGVAGQYDIMGLFFTLGGYFSI